VKHDKKAMIQRAFEHVGFIGIKVWRFGIDYRVWFEGNAPHNELDFIESMGLRYGHADAIQGFITVRWRASFERWYAATIQEVKP
jgi:hypothetical protein